MYHYSIPESLFHNYADLFNIASVEQTDNSVNVKVPSLAVREKESRSEADHTKRQNR